LNSKKEFVLRKITIATLKRKGSCTGCGGISERTCCTNMRLAQEEKPVSNEEDYQLFINLDKRNENWTQKTVDEKGEWIFTCKYLGKNSRCSNYKDRPDVCRRFPESVLDLEKFPHCSYRFGPRSGVVIQSEIVLQAVQQLSTTIPAQK
ncbi:MAG: YkgJ family cysteine cluster protein, partial [Candidatus Margulisbacteria bacterium]|nr:YkgJ family cysteine cluster protein [Candidatus Margulisiibacteriota bacterium]